MAESGKFILRVPPSLHRRLKRIASEKKVSLNQFCVDLLASGVGAHPASHDVHHSLEPLIELGHKFFGEELIGVVAFGSYVRGEATESSDLDCLYIIARSRVPNAALYRAWESAHPSAQRLVGLSVSPHFVNLPARVQRCGGLWLELALEGLVLFDPTLAIGRFLIELRNEIVTGKVRHRYTHGQRYWVWEREAA